MQKLQVKNNGRNLRGRLAVLTFNIYKQLCYYIKVCSHNHNA